MMLMQCAVVRGLLGIATALLLMLALPARAQRTGDAAFIPGGFSGTYDLTLDSPPANSIYKAGSSVTLTLALDGSLCGDGIYIAKPVRNELNTAVFQWRSEAAGLQFTLDTNASVQDTEGRRAFAVSSYAPDKLPVDYGTFKGGLSDTIDSKCDQNAAFFALAQQNYPDLFPGGAFALTRTSETSFSIFFAITDTYLIISNGQVSARGGKFGSTPMVLGNVKNLMVDGVKTLPIPVAATPTSFDSFYTGTYSLTLQNATSFSPIPNGTRLNVVITRDFRLCAGETVIETPLLQADSSNVVWSNSEGGYYYQLKLLPDTTRDQTFQQGNFSMFSTSGRQYGTFTGTRTSLSAECSDAKGVNPDLAEINLMFNLAEQRMPTLFPGGPLTYNQQANGAVYRYYEASGVTVSVSSRQVTVKGGSFGAAPIAAGPIEKVIATLQSSTMPVTLPTALTGTYALKFATAGTFSPVPAGTALDVAITDDGNLCMDGTLYTNPYIDLANVNLVNWKNTQTGYVLQVDTSASTGSTLTVRMQSLKGELLGNLAGSKTLLLAKCAGLVGGNINIDAANQLFTLAEQRQPSTFPPSALTYNQLSNGSLKRYYPSTSVLVTVTGDNVAVSGGEYGSTPRSLGKIGDLVKQLSPTLQSTAALVVTGDMTFRQGNLPAIARRISLSETVAMPQSVAQADLTKLVEQQLGNELNGNSSYVFNVVSNTTTRLEFTVRIVNTTTIAGSAISRNYDLRFLYTRN